MGFHAITYNLMPLGALFAGAIASVTNPAAAISISTSIFVAILIWVMMTQPEIRGIDGAALTERA